ncbi:MAG: CHAP domain-containing protein, partial [Clostridiales bacterium]|nr:CHAP domain-containing protein [Clostridiales bacterium]
MKKWEKGLGILISMLLVLVPVAIRAENKIAPLYPAPDFVMELLEVADEEMGYEEGKNNHTKYGEWFGDPYAQWCAEFLCWCVDQVDQRYERDLLQVQYPLYGGSNIGRDWFIDQGRYIDRKGNLEGWGYQWMLGEEKYIEKNQYIPQAGDWMFFTWRGGPDTDHVAMVEYCSKDDDGTILIHVIE